MAGESYLMEQAKKQWKRFDAEGRKIISDLLTTDTERAESTENTEVHQKERNKNDQSHI